MQGQREVRGAGAAPAGWMGPEPRRAQRLTVGAQQRRLAQLRHLGGERSDHSLQAALHGWAVLAPMGLSSGWIMNASLRRASMGALQRLDNECLPRPASLQAEF